jgi:hypothetical protein
MNASWLTVVIVGAVILIVAAILLRALLSTANPPAWLAFIARRRAEGRPTQWRKWDDDDR